ncbi:FAD-binding oxidoreductase [Candidatus Saccharibacteria bacterium]|nr:FAD-binding oxidoreductase [Candidatus Saccharibacteria bacterium]
MNPFEESLRKSIKGTVSTHLAERRAVRHDSSIFELTPDYVVAPANARDVERLVQQVTAHKQLFPKLSLTPRSAGTDMSGAAIGSSIIVDMTPHFSQIRSLRGTMLHTQPGVYVRDIDPLLAKAGLQLGSVPASRALCTIGGMVGNNSGGEQSLRYGNTEHWVRELKVVLADGKEHTIKPLTKRQLTAKMAEKTFEGTLYKRTYELIESNYDLLRNARPKTHKNSMGYNLWSVWDKERGIFDLTRLFTGSQGTLGILTDITIEAVPKASHSELLLLYLPSLRNLGSIIETVMRHQPATFEGIDDVTFNLGVKYFRTFRRQLGTKEYLRQQAWLLKSVAKFKGHLPALMLMVEFDGESQAELHKKLKRSSQTCKVSSYSTISSPPQRPVHPFGVFVGQRCRSCATR